MFCKWIRVLSKLDSCNFNSGIQYILLVFGVYQKCSDILQEENTEFSVKKSNHHGIKAKKK